MFHVKDLIGEFLRSKWGRKLLDPISDRSGSHGSGSHVWEVDDHPCDAQSDGGADEFGAAVRPHQCDETAQQADRQ
jgi:hypothetical protein